MRNIGSRRGAMPRLKNTIMNIPEKLTENETELQLNSESSAEGASTTSDGEFLILFIIVEIHGSTKDFLVVFFFFSSHTFYLCSSL